MSLLLCSFSLVSCLAFGGEKSAIDLAQIRTADVAQILAAKQKEHGDLIQKKGNLLDLYAKNLEELSQCTGNGDSLLNGVFGSLLHEHEQFSAARKSFEERQHGLFGNHEIIPLLNAQAALIKQGIKYSQDNPLAQLKLKIAADCLSRLMVREFHSHTIDWKRELPIYEKTEEEKQKDLYGLQNTKNHISKERMVGKAFTGWMFSIFSPLAVVGTYAAIKKSSVTAGIIAAVTAVWSGYNGGWYLYLRSLPKPSNEDAYRRLAANLKPELE